MMFLLVLASLLALTLGTTTPVPKDRCCTDHQYEVKMGQVGGSVYNQHGHLTQNWIDGFNIVHHDAFNKRVAVESHQNHANGSTTITNVLLDYQHSRTYIQSNGGCYHIPLTSKMRDTCIPPNATYIGESYMGFGASELKLQNWEFHPQNTDISLRITLTHKGCVPIAEAFVGHQKMPDSTKLAEVNYIYLFNGFRTGLSNPNVFQVPQHCKDRSTRRSLDDDDDVFTDVHNVFSI